MKMQPACVTCIINQSRRVADAIHADATLHDRLVGHVTTLSKTFSLELSPPEIAADVYAQMATIADKPDLYDEVKAHSTRKAEQFLPRLREAIATSSTPLLTATKVAVAGNVIDLAAAVSFDLEEEVDTIFRTPFACDDFTALEAVLSEAKTLLYIGDNVGEHLFDYLYIETLQRLYPQLEITYMVRGCPIINDVTLKEAREAGFEELCCLVESGVDTPGFAYERANPQSQQLFDSADLVLTKGMGNYECLSPSPRGKLCYLLKVKCQVVADALGQEVGDLVCKMV